MKPSLSALIIAKDEEKDLPGCLESLKGLADEIVVLVDESTTDKTEELARKAGCKVGRRKFDDYAGQRQAALQMCTKEWVLWIDCDERLSPELKDALKVVASGGMPSGGFDLPFQVRFLGRTMQFGGLGGEHHVRLFRRDKTKFVGGQLHEGIVIDGDIHNYRGFGCVMHEPYRDISDYLSKLDRYTTLGAQKKFDSGQRFHFWDHLLLPWELFAGLVLKLGILDGYPGVVWATLSSVYTWLKYVKLGELNGRSRPRA